MNVSIVTALPLNPRNSTEAMLEYQLVIRHQLHDNFIDCGDFWDGQRVWWGPGAERKAKSACKRLSRQLPAFHYAEIMETFTA